MFTNNQELPTHEQIERRAYQIYLENGFHPGNALANWLAAEQELTQLSEGEDGRTRLLQISFQHSAGTQQPELPTN